MTPVKEWLLGLLCSWFTLRDLEQVLPWAKAHINIPKEISPVRPGPYDPEAAPLATVLFDFFLDPNWREFVCVKSSQCGMSQAAQILCCYIVEYNLGHIIYVLESAQKAIEVNNERVKVMLRDACKIISDKIPEDEDKLQNRCLNLNGLRIWFAGAKSAGQVASRTVPFIIGDEVDEWEIELRGGESNTLDLLRDRAKLVDNAKIMVFSKPRNSLSPEDNGSTRGRKKGKKDDGIIWQEYLTGSRHKCFVPCPHCDLFQELVWEQVRYAHCRDENSISWNFEKMLRETFYECAGCRQPIHEHHKPEMLARREWRQTNFGTDPHDLDRPIPRKFSCHMSDLYSLFAGSSWGDLAVECASARNTSQKKRFRRSRLALPVEEKSVARTRLSNILRLQGTYQRGHCPVVPELCLFLADVQQHGNLIKWAKLAFTLDSTCYVIDHGETEEGSEIAHLMNTPIIVDDWGTIPETHRTPPRCEIGWIDEGDGQTTKQILDLCVTRALYRRLSPCKGRGGRQTESMSDRVVLQTNRTHCGVHIDRYLVDSDYFLDELYEDRINRFPEIAQADAEGIAPPVPRLWLYQNPDTEFCEEFTTEKKDWHMRSNRLVFGWLPEQEGGKNDFSDTVKMGLALWYRIRPTVLRAHANKLASRKATAEKATP